MPNTKSAIKRMHSTQKKRVQNSGVKARLKTLEKKVRKLAAEGQTEEAATALRTVSSALDKAAKTNTIHAHAVRRKKSRLASLVNAAQAPAA